MVCDHWPFFSLLDSIAMPELKDFFFEKQDYFLGSNSLDNLTIFDALNHPCVNPKHHTFWSGNWENNKSDASFFFEL